MSVVCGKICAVKGHHAVGDPRESAETQGKGRAPVKKHGSETSRSAGQNHGPAGQEGMFLECRKQHEEGKAVDTEVIPRCMDKGMGEQAPPLALCHCLWLIHERYCRRAAQKREVHDQQKRKHDPLLDDVR